MNTELKPNVRLPLTRANDGCFDGRLTTNLMQILDAMVDPFPKTDVDHTRLRIALELLDFRHLSKGRIKDCLLLLAAEREK